MVNSAHLFAASGQEENAVNVYRKCLERFYKGKNEKIELWIARAHYHMKEFDKCREVLQRLIHRHPQNLVYRFNMALCLQVGPRC